MIKNIKHLVYRSLTLLLLLLVLPSRVWCMIDDATSLIQCFEDYYGPSSQWKNEKVFESKVKTLLDQGADPNVQGFLGMTPLHMAESVSVIQMLLDAGALANARDNFEKTPLCKEKLSPEAVQLLLDNGASATDRSRENVTPLHCAGSSEVVKKLVDKGAQVNAQVKLGGTPLMSVVCRTVPQPIVIYDIAKALVELGADPSIETIFNETSLQKVLRNFNCSCILDTKAFHPISGWAYGMDRFIPYYKMVQLLIYAGARVTQEELQMLVYVPDFDDRPGKYDEEYTLNKKDFLASRAAQQRALCSFKNNKVLALLLSHCDERVFNEFKESYLKKEPEKDPEIEALLNQPELLEDAKREYEKFVFEEFRAACPTKPLVKFGK